MEDKKSEWSRDDRMRKLTEGDGGSWVNLSSKSSPSRPIPIASSPRQESFSLWPCLPLCLWRKDGARLSMIGDGHYLNTILEPGPTLLASAVRLETTLMRRETMGQPTTPSSFINCDKKVSRLSWNAWQPPSTLTFSQYAIHSSSKVLLSLALLFFLARCIFLMNTYTELEALQCSFLILNISLTFQFFLIWCSWLEVVWPKGPFVIGPCLSLPTCCYSEGWPQLDSAEIDRTLRCCTLCCNAPPQQVVKSEGCWRHSLAWHRGGAVWRHHTPTKEHTPLYMQIILKDPTAPLDTIVPILKKSDGPH